MIKRLKLRRLAKTTPSPEYLSAAKRLDILGDALTLLQDGVYGTGSDLTQHGHKAIHLAVYTEDEKQVRRVLEFDASQVNLRTKHGDTALHLAARLVLPQIMMFLVKHKADVNATNSVRDTALHMVANLKVTSRSLIPGMLTFLLENGADHTLKNKHGYTAFDIASSGSHDYNVVGAFILYDGRLIHNIVRDNRGGGLFQDVVRHHPELVHDLNLSSHVHILAEQFAFQPNLYTLLWAGCNIDVLDKQGRCLFSKIWGRTSYLKYRGILTLLLHGQRFPLKEPYGRFDCTSSLTPKHPILGDCRQSLRNIALNVLRNQLADARPGQFFLQRLHKLPLPRELKMLLLIPDYLTVTIRDRRSRGAAPEHLAIERETVNLKTKTCLMRLVSRTHLAQGDRSKLAVLCIDLDNLLLTKDSPHNEPWNFNHV